MTTATRTARLPRWVVAFLPAVLAVAVGLFTAGPASALTPSAAQTRVGASHSTAGVLVGLSTDITAGQRLGNDPPRPGIVVATGVAANTGTARFVVNSAGDVLDTTRVSIPAGKFDYLLKNPSKSGVFSDSMGFDQAGLDSALRSHLTGNFGSASPSVPMVGGGTKFTVRGPMTGPSGQTWDITTAWGVDPNGTIRLITATP